MFMHIPPDDHDDFDDRHWSKLEALFADQRGAVDEDQFSRFFRDFLMIDGRYVQPKETFATFESRYEATGFSPVTLARDLLLAANDYDVICGDKVDIDKIVTTQLSALNQLESSTTYPLILVLFRLRREGRLQADELAECLRMLCGFIFRRFITSESSRGYGQVFVRAIPWVMKTSPVNELKQYLLERGWPDDTRFEAAFGAFPLYQRGYKKECLATMETAARHKEPADLKNVQVEHIMPQTLTDQWIRELGDDAKRIHSEWLHRPGSLTLSAYNPELGNQPFSTKRVRFEQSNVGLTRDLGGYKKWSEDEIRTRGEMLAKKAKDIWIGPAEPFIEETDAEPAADIAARDLRLHFWTGLSEYLAELDATLPSLEPKPHRSIRLPSIAKNIGVELRYMVQRQEFAIDVYYWRPASHAVWERLKSNPAELNEVTGGEWIFNRGEGLSAWMTLRLEASTTDSASWPAIYEWAGRKLRLLYGQIVPLLREELGSRGHPSG